MQTPIAHLAFNYLCALLPVERPRTRISTSTRPVALSLVQRLPSQPLPTRHLTFTSQQLHAPAPCVLGPSGLRSTPCLWFIRVFLAPACSRGSFCAIAVKRSRTFSAVLAEVSKNSKPASLAYASASAFVIARLSGCSATKSALLPARAIIIFSLACR